VPVALTATVAMLLASAVGTRVQTAPSPAATGAALAAGVGSPRGLAVGPKGEIYIASPDPGRVFELGVDGKLRVIAGEAYPLAPAGLAVDPAGNVYVSDPDAARVYRIDASSRSLKLMAGTGTVQGDEGPATAARLVRPVGLACTRKGELLIADAGDHRVRRVDGDGRIHTVAGDGTPGVEGDGGPAVRARLSRPEAVAADRRGNVYIADRGNRRVRRVAAKNGAIATWAATGLAGPTGLSVDDTGSLWIADPENRRILKLDRDGVAVGGWSDPNAAPEFVAWDSGRGLLFSDGARQAVLRVSHGRAELVAGNAVAESPGR
jgi:DNA-binding beta-propeller fold protein YncE